MLAGWTERLIYSTIIACAIRRYERTERRDMGDRPIDAALPEAPASANFRLTTPQGIAVQWTLRGFCEADLAARVGEFLAARLDAGHTINGMATGATSADVAASPGQYTFPLSGKPGDAGDPGEHVAKIPCPVCSGLHLYRRANEGGWWYSHKRDDGSYCKGIA